MPKNKKGKTILTISIGCTAFILTMIMFTQFKTVKETDITGIETMRETELRAELASWKSKYEDVLTKTEETEDKIDGYTEQVKNNDDLTELLFNELKEANMYAGYTDLQGEGIIITLEDNDNSQIVASDLITLINELKIAGAEAISINGERVVSTTDLTDINYTYIIINTAKYARISSPYTIKAIGNQKYLESAINVKYGYLDSMEANGKTASYVLSNNVVVEKYDGDLTYNYAKEVKE